MYSIYILILFITKKCNFLLKIVAKIYIMVSMNYYIETFGCQMNVHDSEKIAGMLGELGYTDTSDITRADIIVFNTCCVRGTAELKIMSQIGETKRLKKQNPNLKIVVMGCMTQQKGMPEELRKKFPFITLILGTHNLEELKNYLVKTDGRRKTLIDVWESAGKVVEGITPYRNSGDNAWVNIMYGCNNFCTYCIVPYVRGRERSRRPEDIIKEARGLVREGYKSVTLLGQNVNSYGLDFKDENINFVSLLKQVCDIEGDFEVKFMTSHPKDFSDELIDFIAKTDKMSKQIHLPVQSGSDNMLKAMNRHYDIARYKYLVTEIYKKVKDVKLTTDIIVGFPGETEEDFEKTLELMKFCRYSGVFGFVYSKRRGTPAEKFPNQVPANVKKDRITRLFALQHKIQNGEEV